MAKANTARPIGQIVRDPETLTLSEIRDELETLSARFREDPASEFTEAEERYYRRLMERLAPSEAQVEHFLKHEKSSEINYDHEDDELPC